MKRIFILWLFLPLVSFGLLGDTYVPALADGSGVDAVGDPLDILGGFVHNSCPYSITQTDYGIVNLITVNGVTNGTIFYEGLDSGKPSWKTPASASIEVVWDGNNWVVTDNPNGSETWTHPTSTATFPPLTEWPLGSEGSDAISLTYSSFWIESGELATNNYAALIGHTNAVHNTMVKVNNDWMVTDILTYDSGWTPIEWMILN